MFVRESPKKQCLVVVPNRQLGAITPDDGEMLLFGTRANAVSLSVRLSSSTMRRIHFDGTFGSQNGQRS